VFICTIPIFIVSPEKFIGKQDESANFSAVSSPGLLAGGMFSIFHCTTKGVFQIGDPVSDISNTSFLFRSSSGAGMAL
jgi:hypothetical protein